MFLYTLTNRISGLVYVGATTLSLPRRMDGHVQDSKDRSTAINLAIRQYGWESFDLSVLATTDDRDELMRMECETIKRLGTMVPNGYNMTSGGMGWSDMKHSAETRAKLSAQKMGSTPWNKDLRTGPLSEECKAKLSAIRRGRIPWNKGVKATENHKAKLVAKARRGAAHLKARAIEFEGVKYGSIVDCEHATGLSKMQMKYRLRLGIAKYL